MRKFLTAVLEEIRSTCSVIMPMLTRAGFSVPYKVAALVAVAVMAILKLAIQAVWPELPAPELVT